MIIKISFNSFLNPLKNSFKRPTEQFNESDMFTPLEL